MRALAEAPVMDSGALAHTLKPLERDRLVDVAIDPDDRRNRLITLTPKGRAKLAEIDALRKALRFLVSDNFVATFESSLTSSVQ